MNTNVEDKKVLSYKCMCLYDEREQKGKTVSKVENVVCVHKLEVREMYTHFDSLNKIVNFKTILILWKFSMFLIVK